MPKMPEPDDVSPAELSAMMDQGLEDFTGKPVNKGSLVRNIAALKQRILMLENSARTMSETAANNPECDLELATDELARLRLEKAQIQQRLTDYEQQLSQLN